MVAVANANRNALYIALYSACTTETDAPSYGERRHRVSVTLSVAHAAGELFAWRSDLCGVLGFGFGLLLVKN